MSFTINAINNNPSNQLYYAAKTLTPTQIKGMFASPVLFDTVPAPAANQAIIIRNYGFNVSFNTTAYTAGGSVGIYYDSSRTQFASSSSGAGTINATSSICTNPGTVTGVIAATNSIGKSLYISNATQAFATGDSNVTFFAYYSIVTFDNSFHVNTPSTGNAFQVAELYIPSASVQTLNATPITIVPAAGSGIMLVPERMISLLIYNSAAYSASTVNLIYGTSGSTILTNAANLIAGAVKQWNAVGLGTVTNFATSNADNNALQIKASANPGTSGNSALKIYLSYSTITL